MTTPLVSPTLGKLISNVRNLLNQPSAANSFWSDAELSEYLNEAIRTYFVEITKDNEGQFTKQATLDVVSGQEAITLPTDFFEIRAAYMVRNQGNEVIPYDNNLSQSYSTQGASSGNTFSPLYFFRGNTLVLRPTPQFSQTGAILIEYMALPDTLITGGDTMHSGVSPVFKQLIEMYAVHKAKLKESLVNGADTASIAKQNRDEIYMIFKDTIRGRSKYPVFTVPFNPESEI